jgi:hypothetical protein
MKIARNVPLACLVALAVAITARPQRAEARPDLPPPVPENIQVPAGHKLYFVGHAYGTQNYICLPSPSAPGFAWTLFGPQANLFDDAGRQLTTHFSGPNPDESGTLRPAWQHSRDTSIVWGQAVASSTDAGYVAPGAIPWLLIRVVGSSDGPKNGRSLTATAFLQRLNTAGGMAPSSGCEALADVGKRSYVPYTADYFFYKAARHHGTDTN